MSADHINSFCVSDDEKIIFAGDKIGQIWVIAVEDFKVIKKIQAHAGTIQAMVSHPQRNLFAVLSKDRTVSVWIYDENKNISNVFSHSIRGYGTNHYKTIHSESQAIDLHPTQDILMTRSGDGSAIEIDFSDANDIKLKSIVRVFENVDVATCRYISKEGHALLGSFNGKIALVINGKIQAQWKFDDVTETIHWFEPTGGKYFVAVGDCRKILRFCPHDPQDLFWSECVSNDDIEIATYDKTSKVLFVSSFDRHLYQINPYTLQCEQKIFEFPFKLRWIKILKTQPSIMIVQVRDGSLIKFSITQKKILAKLKHTPHALWSLCMTSTGEIVTSGEGERYHRLIPNSFDRDYRASVFGIKNSHLTNQTQYYTKRIIHINKSHTTLFGRTDGSILSMQNEKVEPYITLDSAIRDMTYCPPDSYFYVVTEGGWLYKIDTSKREIVKKQKYDQPLWSLALNVQCGIVAVGERMGKIRLLDSDTFQLKEETFSRIPKRMKWFKDCLFVSHSQFIDKIFFEKGEWVHSHRFYLTHQNTIEDFCWDPDGKYLVAINYAKSILLFDMPTGTLLSQATDNIDYMKGILHLENDAILNAYPYDFLIVGRYGRIRHYRVHDEQIHMLKEMQPEYGY